MIAKKIKQKPAVTIKYSKKEKTPVAENKEVVIGIKPTTNPRTL
ncbi:MAG TPA: hypothetical protein PKW80_10290 [Bacteroidales bacterium]|nr:hypothetical protein [Bacteroidales bacterium]